MDSAALIVSGLIVACLLVIAFAVGWQKGSEAQREISARFTDRAVETQWEGAAEAIAHCRTNARKQAFERAAEAVLYWQHRIVRRAELMKLLKYLGSATASELGAATPNIEDRYAAHDPGQAADDEGVVLVSEKGAYADIADAMRASVGGDFPFPSSAPVATAQDRVMPPDRDDDTSAAGSRIDPMEGFL